MENTKHKHKDVVIKKIDGELIVTSRQVAEDFEKRHADVLRAIEDLNSENAILRSQKYFIETYYKVEGNNKNYKEYLLTRDGFSLLVMGFTGSKALQWKLKYIEAFNKMEQELKGQALNTSELSPELQMFKQIFDSVAKQQLEAKETKRIALTADSKAEEAKEEIQGIRDIVAINTSTMSWREDCRKIIVRIANKLGGNAFIGDVNREIYELMRIRLKVRLDVKLTNLRRRMAEEGVCKSKREKTNYLDVIKGDSRLVEGYVSIVKELAVKYGADFKEVI